MSGFQNILGWLLGWRSWPHGGSRIFLRVAAGSVFISGAISGEEFCSGAVAGEVYY